MKKIKLVSLDGKKLETEIKLNENVFIKEPNDKVLHDAIILSRASLRQGTHKTKNRAEVRGGGRKPWRQKGTGRARVGSIRSVIWVGGGVYAGPTPRSYSKKQNKKERQLALKSALSHLALDNNVVVVENLDLKTNKTKDFIKVLDNLKISDKKVLVVVDEISENIVYATSNLPNVLLLESNELNVLDLVTADTLLITEKALKEVEEVLA